MKDNKSNVTTVKAWFGDSHSEQEKRELFLYLDFAMRYVHDRGYCVYTFDPNEIEILNNSVKQVKFNTLLEMPKDDTRFQNKLKDEDIYNSAAVQVLLYSKFPINTKTEFIKEHFDDFTTFLPESDVRYYRGVLQDNAAIYFTEFEQERIRRESENLEKELSDMTKEKVVSLDEYKKKKDLIKMLSNDKINNTIYRSINVVKESAFINILLYPTVMIVLFLVYTFMCYIIRILGI